MGTKTDKAKHETKINPFDFSNFEKINDCYDTIPNLEIVNNPDYKFNKDDKSLYILLRHSERADQVHGEENRIIDEEDPGITKNGENIAYYTGKLIQDLIRKIKIAMLCGKDAVPVIVSSNYLRCLQTSKNIIKGLKDSGVDVYKNAIFMEEGWMERQDDKKYKGAKEWVKLVIEKMTQEQRNEFLGDIKLVKNQIMYYEKYEDLRRKAYDKGGYRWMTLYQNMPEIAYLNRKKFIFVVVSQGCSLETFAYVNYGGRCNAGYCSTN